MKKNRLILAFLGCLFFFFSEAQSNELSNSFEQKIEEYIASDDPKLQRKGLSSKLALATTAAEKEAIQQQLENLQNANKIDASTLNGSRNSSIEDVIQKEDERIWQEMVNQLRGEEDHSINKSKNLQKQRPINYSNIDKSTVEAKNIITIKQSTNPVRPAPAPMVTRTDGLVKGSN